MRAREKEAWSEYLMGLREKVAGYLRLSRVWNVENLLADGIVKGSDGIIRLTVTSHGRTDKEWLEYVRSVLPYATDYGDLQVLLESEFPTTNRVRYEVEIIPGSFWNSNRAYHHKLLHRATKNIYAFGAELGLTMAPAEVALLLWERLKEVDFNTWGVGIDTIMVLHSAFKVSPHKVLYTGIDRTRDLVFKLGGAESLSCEDVGRWDHVSPRTSFDLDPQAVALGLEYGSTCYSCENCEGVEWPRNYGFALMVEPWAHRNFHGIIK